MTNKQFRRKMQRQMQSNASYAVGCVAVPAILALVGSLWWVIVIGTASSMYLSYKFIRHTYACGMLAGTQGSENEVFEEIEQYL